MRGGSSVVISTAKDEATSPRAKGQPPEEIWEEYISVADTARRNGERDANTDDATTSGQG